MSKSIEQIIAEAWVQSWDQHIGQDGAIAVLNAITAAGYVVVPKEPSKEMIAIGNCKIEDCIDSWNYDSDCGYSVGQSAASDCWHAMIANLFAATESAS